MSHRFVLCAVVLTVVVLAGAFAVSESFSSSDVAASAEPATSSGSNRSDEGSDVTATAVPVASTAPTTSTAPATPPADLLPAVSGDGRRVVFSVAGQRMWWVDEAGVVVRTNLVSGRANTPAHGTFQVYSRTEHATGLDGSKMDYFVRFTKGSNGWAIGFHDIPEVGGVPVQTDAQLGQALSHGCIRQGQDDALFTWDFLQVGDKVVVVA